MCETWALGALANSEFNLFFKASTVTSLKTTTASRTPSDKSEYIYFYTFSVIQSYFLVFCNIARFKSSYCLFLSDKQKFIFMMYRLHYAIF